LKEVDGIREEMERKGRKGHDSINIKFSMFTWNIGVIPVPPANIPI
jgi:hypothetical protein